MSLRDAVPVWKCLSSHVVTTTGAQPFPAGVVIGKAALKGSSTVNASRACVASLRPAGALPAAGHMPAGSTMAGPRPWRVCGTRTARPAPRPRQAGGHDGTIRLWDPITGTPGAVIPLGIGVHALLQQRPDPAARERTSGGATITAGLSTGILALDLHRDLFQR